MVNREKKSTTTKHDFKCKKMQILEYLKSELGQRQGKVIDIFARKFGIVASCQGDPPLILRQISET